MAKIFQERIQFIREIKSLTTDDFSKVVRIESMLMVCSDHLEEHKAKVSQVNMDKEVWKQCILYIGLPYFQVILNFSATQLEWHGMHSSTTKKDKSNDFPYHDGVLINHGMGCQPIYGCCFNFFVFKQMVSLTYG